MMDRTIVQNQDEWTFTGMLLYEMLEKSNEGFTVALVGYLVDHLIGDPVVSAKEMTPLLLSWCRDPLLATALHPTSHQDRQPT